MSTRYVVAVVPHYCSCLGLLIIATSMNSSPDLLPPECSNWRVERDRMYCEQPNNPCTSLDLYCEKERTMVSCDQLISACDNLMWYGGSSWSNIEYLRQARVESEEHFKCEFSIMKVAWNICYVVWQQPGSRLLIHCLTLTALCSQKCRQIIAGTVGERNSF